MVESHTPQSAPSLLFVHGWALDASIWSPLRAALTAWPHAVFDAGYFGQTQHAQSHGPVVVVGHSLGFLRSLHALPPACIGLIAINGFTRFCAGPGYEEGVSTRVVDRMLARLDTHTNEVVHAFRARCGLGAPPAPPCREPLLHDLHQLRHTDGRQAASTCPLPLLVLAGGRDTVVPDAMTRAGFASARHARLHWHAEAGHMLPVSHPQWCAHHIASFLDTLVAVHG